MRYWDSSALIPLISEEPTSGSVNDLLRDGAGIAVWWGTWIECSVAISRRRREGTFDEEAEEEVRAALDRLAEEWDEIRPTNDLRLLASIITKYHPLKAADALQLAAALRWCEGSTRGKGFVRLGERLRRSADDEGFDVLPPPGEAA